VLKPSGFALITCPDLEQVAQRITEGKLEETAYVSPAGPITAFDMLFGHSASLAHGNLYMAHKSGFTTDRLGRLLEEAGFAESWIAKGRSYDLWAVALMSDTDREALKRALASTEQSYLVP